ncbi:MAG: hypothetical protein AAB495_03220 [Patescibacteria group bacterium]
MKAVDLGKTIGVLVAGTMGAGIFALPALFRVSGWATGFFYLFALGALVSSVHLLYWKVLEKTNGEHRLFGLVERFLGKNYAVFAFLLVVFGLALVLLIYLLLGEKFLSFLFPELNGVAIYAFWIAASVPLFFGIKKVAGGESLVALATGGIALFLFAKTQEPFAIFEGSAFSLKNIALPFGPILFAVSGWVSTQTMFNAWRANKRPGTPRFLIAAGTLTVLLIYSIFVMSTAQVAGGVSGGIDLPSWAGVFGKEITTIIALFGLLAVWAAYIPLALEIKSTMESDLRMSKAHSLLVALLTPLALFSLGLKNFLGIVGLVGGVFGAAQYILLLLVAKKALDKNTWQSALIGLGIAVFSLGGAYEIYHFLFA